MADEIIERSFPLSGPARLRLGNIRGTVIILPGEDDLITVSAVKHAGSGSMENTQVEMRQAEDGGVIVKTHYASDIFGRFFNMGKPCKVDYDVRVPPACTLKVSGVSCNTQVKGISGEIDLETVSGSLTIEEVNGNIEISSVSGDILGAALTGSRLRINTVSGDAELTRADFPAIIGRTVSGDLRIETPLGEGPYDFNTVSGDIVLVVPTDTRCTVKVKGISGGFKSKLPLTNDQRRNGTHFAEVMGGGVLVNLNTVSGYISLKPPAGEEVEAQRARDSEAGYARVSHTDILDKIERGEISVDEGVQALKS